MNAYRFATLLEVMPPEEQKAFEDRAFGEWMKKVDDTFQASLGVSSRDLPDFRYRGMFDEGAAPGEAVAAWIEEYGEEFGLDPDGDFE